MRDLDVLSPEVKGAHLNVTRYHHRLLERLAQIKNQGQALSNLNVLLIPCL